MAQTLAQFPFVVTTSSLSTLTQPWPSVRPTDAVSRPSRINSYFILTPGHTSRYASTVFTKLSLKNTRSHAGHAHTRSHKPHSKIFTESLINFPLRPPRSAPPHPHRPYALP